MTEERFKDRQEKLRKKLGDQSVDALLVTNILNIRYLTGFSGTHGALVFDAEPLLLVDGRYREQAESEAVGVDVVTVSSSTLIMSEVGRALGERSLKRVGFEAAALSAGDYLTLFGERSDVVPARTDNAVEEFRAHKDREEIQRLRQAARIAETALESAWEAAAPGRTEADLAGVIEQTQRAMGSDGSAARLLVSSGPRTQMPHGAASTKELQAGEPILIDVSSTWRGYRADITRLAFLGDIPDDYHEVFAVISQAQDLAFDNVKPGMLAREVDELVRGHIAASGYGEAFTHASGHGIGLGQHEIPILSSRSDMMIEPGMVITFEPGIYLSGKWGARLEDAVVVTETGCEVLWPVEREIRVL